MIKLITALLAIISEFFRIKRESDLKQQGRDDFQKELDANVQKAEAASNTPDASRTERLRSRFDRSKG